MSNTEHIGGAAHRSFRCTFGPVREVDLVCSPPDDLVWPPADEDVDAFTVVRLDGSDVETRIESPGSEPAAPEPVRLRPRRIKPTFGDCRALGAAPRVRPLVVPMEPPPLPEPPQFEPPLPEPIPHEPALSDTLTVTPPPLASPEDARVAPAEAPPPLPFAIASATQPGSPETIGAGRSVWLAGLFVAAACALVTLVEYRAPIRLPVDASEAPPTPPELFVEDAPAPAFRAVPPSASRKPSALPAPAAAGRAAAAATRRPIPGPAPQRAVTPAPVPRVAAVTPRREVVEPAPPAAPRVTVDVHDRGAIPPPSPAAAPVMAPPPVATAAAARPEPLAKAAPVTPVAAVLTDEDDIRSTLTRFRTAYSKLDAGAARDVWPSVDHRALERAFQSLKSQDLRFDSCRMTVTGARAQAACKGRAVYVPRVGDQSPRVTSREWSFELRKADERWTIASARSL